MIKRLGVVDIGTLKVKLQIVYVLQQLQPVPKDLSTPIIYGSSCIIELFQNLNLPLEKHEASPTHPYKVSVAQVKNFLEQVWPISYGARERKYQSPTTRYMWGIDKAFLNVTILADKINSPYIIPSNANINQGLIASLLENQLRF